VGHDAVTDAFAAYLREHGLPVTSQRLEIARVMLGSERHLSADDVATELDTRGSGIGLATVYRTIDLLVKSGLVVERDFGEGFRRYEHLLCTVCGKVREFRDERLERMTTLVAEAHGYARQRHRLVIYGVCGDCQRGPGPAVVDRR
jgi:Fur family transcriptional regulator, ferric uptake regulator